VTERVVVVQISVTLEGQALPEVTSTIRVKWPDGQTLAELLEAESRRYCRQLNAPKPVETLA
jgi:hypothetical protein